MNKLENIILCILALYNVIIGDYITLFILLVILIWRSYDR